MNRRKKPKKQEVTDEELVDALKGLETEREEAYAKAMQKMGVTFIRRGRNK